jgi:hypothetical protein
MTRPLSVVLVLLALLLAGCGGEASTCEEIADQTIDLAQQLIDDVEDEVGDLSLDTILSGENGLPAVEDYAERSDRIDARAAELGCASADLELLVAQRTDRLTAETPVGVFIVDAIRSGGL